MKRTTMIAASVTFLIAAVSISYIVLSAVEHMPSPLSSASPTLGSQSASNRLPSADATRELNNLVQNAGLVLVTPFSKVTNERGNTVYTGMIKSGDTRDPYVYSVSIEQVNQQNSTALKLMYS